MQFSLVNYVPLAERAGGPVPFHILLVLFVLLVPVCVYPAFNCLVFSRAVCIWSLLIETDHTAIYMADILGPSASRPFWENAINRSHGYMPFVVYAIPDVSPKCGRQMRGGFVRGRDTPGMRAGCAGVLSPVTRDTEKFRDHVPEHSPEILLGLPGRPSLLGVGSARLRGRVSGLCCHVRNYPGPTQ